MDYEKDTRQAYRNVEAVRVYKMYQTEDLWFKFTILRSESLVRKALKLCLLPGEGKILDFPCGTGILASVLGKLPCRVVAADISREMMLVAQEEYQGSGFNGFVQGDITQAPFKEGIFSCVIVLGLMHRIPRKVRCQVLKEINLLTARFVIISYSIDNRMQRLKKALLKKLKPGHRPALAPATWSEVRSDLRDHGLVVLKKFSVMPFLSSQAVLLLEKNF